MSNKHFSIKITGKVQGVFFRASTKEKADELGVKGFVRNEPDGSVYVEVEGAEYILDQFIDWCTHGPERAWVEKMEPRPGEKKGFKDFEVRK